MPWPILLIIAGLILWFATSYVTLGMILTFVGVGLLAFVLIVYFLILGKALSFHRQSRREFDNFFNNPW